MKVFIEVEAGSQTKYLYDEKSLKPRGTRELLAPYPYPYGFIMGTQTDDGEAVDAYIITSRNCPVGAAVECEPAGMLPMDEGDEIDQKILAVVPGDKTEITESIADEIRSFIYTVFKAYPNVIVKVGELQPRETAVEHLRASGLEEKL